MEIGQRVRDRYVIEAIAGSGGMGTVYRARDHDDSPVAIKVLSAARADYGDRFAREARVLMTLRHPAIVRCLDSGITASGEHFLVMEWLDGIELTRYVADQRLTIGESLALVGRLAHALGTAHERLIVHRDVKPSNIFLPGSALRDAVLLDFGVAHWSSATRLTGTGTQIGTPSYMAPEQIRGEPVDARADVFALGCILHLCLTGDAAYAGDQANVVFYKILMEERAGIASLVHGVPASVVALADAMMAKDPAARPRNGAEVAARIEAVQADVMAGAVRLTPAPVAASPRSITDGEQRLVSIVAVAGAHEPPPSGLQSVTLPANSDHEPTVSAHSSVAGEPSPADTAGLNELARRYEPIGVRFERLAGGAVVAVVDTGATATDQADVAARIALKLRGWIPRAVSVATGRAMVGAGRVLGEVLERNQALLSAPGTEQRPIRICDMTAALLGGRFELLQDEHGAVLVRERTAVGHSRLLGQHTPFVGRLREMALLTATFEECVGDGLARVALITAAPGMGKSRLMRELLQRIGERGDEVGVWQCSGDAMRAGSPLDLLAHAIRGLAGVLEGEPVAVRRDKLAARVARSVPAGDADRVAAFLGELIDAPWPDAGDVKLRAARRDSRLMNEQIRRACRDFLAAETHRHPVLVALEDLHWADQATVAWLDAMLDELADRPLLVVAAGRPEVHELFPGVWSRHDLVELRLRGLSAHNANKLIHAALGADVTIARAAELVERADGNPFFLEELIRCAAGQREFPDTVLAMVHARLQEIPPTARRVLRAASIMGERLWSGSLHALCGERVTGMEIDWLVDAELLVEASSSKFAGQDEYRFRHALIREAAYGMLTDGDRRLGHRLAARWLVEVGEADALVVAGHFERGGEPERARPFLARAALDACNSGDLDAALAIARRGAAIGGDDETQGTLLAVQVKALHWQGSHDEVIATGERALSLLPAGGRAWYEVAENMTASHGLRNDIAALEARAASMAGGRSDGHDRSGWLILAARLGWMLLIHGRQEAARALLAQLDREMEADADVDPAVAARVHQVRGCRGWFVDGNPAALLRELRQAVARYDEVGDLHNACDQRVNAGFAEMELGLYPAAEATLRTALATARERELDALVAGCEQNLGLVLGLQGKYGEARALALASAESHEQRGDHRMATGSRMYLATVAVRAGELAEAENQARAALALSPDRSPVQVTVLATLARVLLALGRPDEALAHATRAIELMEELGDSHEAEATVRLVWAEVLDDSGQRQRAREVIALARDRLLARAETIDTADWRRSFLERVPDHARTLELFETWRHSRAEPAEAASDAVRPSGEASTASDAEEAGAAGPAGEAGTGAEPQSP